MGRAATVAAAAGLAAGWCAAPAGADEFVDFSSPSGNVGCVMDVGYVRCDIDERAWASPPKPADCDLDYGQGVMLQAGEPAEFVCAGDTTLGRTEVLAYGRSMVRGSLKCDSAETSITCLDRNSGHGFSLAREVYQLF
ncbi:DUF6636 domain-containing protein [Mycobacterium sp. AMU20-3851]|uniref:DUF6636 domain-containing protein n=1 Tax=Mycobacterium sp. AMU20-3851 TaxID=3122055 RepID=UPI0037547682